MIIVRFGGFVSFNNYEVYFKNQQHAEDAMEWIYSNLPFKKVK